MSKIKNVTVHYPTPENKEEFDRRLNRVVAKHVIETYPPEVVDLIIKRLEELQEIGV